MQSMRGANRAGPARTVADLVAVAGTATVVGGVLAAQSVQPWLQVAFAASLLLFLPGYAVVAALVPSGGPRRAEWLPDGVERLALSFATSVAILPVLALVLAPLGALGRVPVVTVLVALTLVGCAAAAVRRLVRPPSERFALPLRRWVAISRDATVGATPGRAFTNVVLALAIVIGLGGFGYALAAPQQGDSYTSASLLTRQPNGDLVEGNFTDTVREGAPVTFTLRLENREGRDVDYVAVVVLERVRADGGNVTVLQRSTLERTELALNDRETVFRRLTVRPNVTGRNLRLSVYVYRGDPPPTPTSRTAVRHLYVWMNVTGGRA